MWVLLINSNYFGWNQFSVKVSLSLVLFTTVPLYYKINNDYIG